MKRGITDRFCLALTLLSVVTLTCHHPIPNHAPNPPGIPSGPTDAKARIQYTYSAQATDPEGDSIDYQFDFGTGDTITWSRLVPSATPCSASTMWYADGNYAVRARARDHHYAVSEWSAALSVGIGNSAPPTPEFIYAPDTVWAGTMDTISVISIDPDNDPVRYVIDWGDSAATDTYAFAQNGSLGTFGRHWLYPGSYPVRALAMDSHGRPSDWSAPRTITVPGPPLRWRYRAGAGVDDALALGPDGTVYFVTDNLLQALNTDGTPKWQYRPYNSHPTPVSVSPKNTVYLRARSMYLSALSGSGALDWSVTFTHHGSTSQIMTSALGLNGIVYHRADSLYALDASGAILWRSGRGHGNNGPPAIGADGTVYFSSDKRDSVYALNPDGTLRWGAYYANAWYYAPPVVGLNGTVYVCGRVHELAAFSADGIQLWVRAVHGSSKAFPPAVGPDGTIYYGGYDGLSAINPDGTLKWLFATKGEVDGTPAITADSSIIFGCNNNLLYAVGPDGKIRWARGTRGSVRSSPVIAPDGTIYFGSNDGYVYAVAGTSPLADSPWPMFGHDPQHTNRAGTW
jgi:outer membrane protein assembly factor BamB